MLGAAGNHFHAEVTEEGANRNLGASFRITAQIGAATKICINY